MIALALVAAMVTPPECLHIGPLYWEMGTASGQVESSVKGSSVRAESLLPAEFATSWLFAAYAVQTHPLNAPTRDALRMISGFSGLTAIACAHARATTVGACAASGRLVPETKGRLYYNLGHLQRWAAENGLGGDSADQLGKAMSAALGVPLQMEEPFPATGAYVSATAYAAFLRKLLNRQLKLSALLGEDAVGEGVFSPVPASWRYSYGHFVEDDGTLSNPGRYGFYPWINGNSYGVIARRSSTPTALMDSVKCGRALRKAWTAEHE